MSAQEVQTTEERTPSSSSSSSFVSRGLEARFLEIVISLHSLQFARISVHLYAILYHILVQYCLEKPYSDIYLYK